MRHCKGGIYCDCGCRSEDRLWLAWWAALTEELWALDLWISGARPPWRPRARVAALTEHYAGALSERAAWQNATGCETPGEAAGKMHSRGRNARF